MKNQSVEAVKVKSVEGIGDGELISRLHSSQQRWRREVVVVVVGGGVKQPPVFELSAAEVALRPGRWCDTIISV